MPTFPSLVSNNFTADIPLGPAASPRGPGVCPQWDPRHLSHAGDCAEHSLPGQKNAIGRRERAREHEKPATEEPRLIYLDFS